MREDHVAPVQALVDEIRRERGTESVPYVDPDSGGAGARVLFILESPAGPAALGSGMLSPDNNDETAANMWRLYEQGACRARPACTGTPCPGTSARTAERSRSSPATCWEGAVWLDRLLDRLPDLRLIVTMGKHAKDAFQAYVDVHGGDRVAWLAAPHCSGQAKSHPPGRRTTATSSASPCSTTALANEYASPHWSACKATRRSACPMRRFNGMSDDAAPTLGYDEFNLDGIWPSDTRQAVREALRLIEEAARKGRDGTSLKQVADLLEQARNRLRDGIGLIPEG